MRVEEVTAHAFGPLADATMKLASGLTVVYGVNESAKSSWHAAICSALVGRRRGRGRPSSEDQRYSDLHKPWDRSGWRVSAIITLDDGRRIELMQDLDGEVDCRARDLTLGRDVSDEIIHDGSPDASRWLGLDRQSFVATACVSQADLLLDLSDAQSLQVYLQRAASTRGVDATAAAALAAIDQFSRDHVGLDRTNSTKPLRVAIDRLELARGMLARAQHGHREYLALVEVADQNKQAVLDAGVQSVTCEEAVAAATGLIEAVNAAEEAHRTHESARRRVIDIDATLESDRRTLQRVRELHGHFGGAAPDGIATQDGRYQTAASAIARWRALPAARTLSGPTSAELRSELDQLPSEPDGETEPTDDVRLALDRVHRAVVVADAHNAQRPGPPRVSDEPMLDAAIVAGPSLVRDLAAQLETASSQQSPATADDLEGYRRERDAARQRSEQNARNVAEAGRADERARMSLRDAMTVAAHQGPMVKKGLNRTTIVAWAMDGVLAMAGVVLVAVGQVVPGIAALAVAAGAGLALRSRAPPARGRGAVHTDVDALSAAAATASKDLNDARAAALDTDRTSAVADARYDAARRAGDDAAAGRNEVIARCRTRGLPADVEHLRRLGALAEHIVEHRRRLATWDKDRRPIADAVTRADESARAVLREHGHGGNESLQTLLQIYVTACRERAFQASLGSRRPYLLQSIADREAAEAASARATQLREDAFQALVDAAQTCELEHEVADGSALDGDALAEALDAWQQRRDVIIERTEHEQQEWTEFTTLLDGATIEELESSVATLVQQHECATSDERNAREACERQVFARDERVEALGLDSAGACDHHYAQLRLDEARSANQAAQRRLAHASSSAGDAEGVLRERARGLLSVPEAEEAVAGCEAELERVRRLERTLALTRAFLSDAQDRVHRDIAPRLASTLREWLPAVTANRYVDATVDPARLEVLVCGPSRRWRPAGCLSVGTTEQIYLLLRVALAQHLVTTVESCPLLLDDVTVQADDERTC